MFIIQIHMQNQSLKDLTDWLISMSSMALSFSSSLQ